MAQWTDSTQPDYGQFELYVAPVHGEGYRNAPFTYAYSVDDALGNMQTDGTGLIIAVGGAAKSAERGSRHARGPVHLRL
jgi:hypothetical protein